MTLDQIWSRLCKVEILKREVESRVEKMEPGAVTGNIIRPDADGLIQGRAEDGTPIRGKVRGVSKARMLMIKQMEEQAQKDRKSRKGRRKQHGN